MPEMEVLYIGAGKDIEPIYYFNKYNNFIFVESQPYREYGLINNGFNDSNGFSRKIFINELNIEMNKMKFKLIGLSENLNVYKNDHHIKSKENKKKKKENNIYDNDTCGKLCKKIYYYYNTPLPLFNHIIKDKIKNIKLIIVKDHNSDYSILRDLRGIDFLGHYKTIYDKNNIENKNSIINQLHTNFHFRQKFNNFYYFTKKNELKKFNHWDKFYNYYLIYH